MSDSTPASSTPVCTSRSLNIGPRDRLLGADGARWITEGVRLHGPARGHGFELVERLSDELRQVSLVGCVDPAFERDPEGGDACLGSQTRGWVYDAAPAQRVGRWLERAPCRSARTSPRWWAATAKPQ